jgi:hypothetical protein
VHNLKHFTRIICRISIVLYSKSVYISVTMVATRCMAALTDPTTPPSAKRIDCPNNTKSFDTVVPHSAATASLPPPMQREHDNYRETKSCWVVNISDITRIRLRCRIKKIYDMSTSVVEGYGTFYYNKHGNPLPQETVDKIMHI